MGPVRPPIAASIAAALCCFAQLCAGQAADYYSLIMQGKVVMPDGSPPPKSVSVGVERICSDIQGSAPGPLVDKTGHYLWRMDLAPADTRSCFIRAVAHGLTSSRLDIDKLGLSDYRQGKVINLPDIVLSAGDGGAGNETVLVSDDQVPAKARPAYKLASKALEANNTGEAIKQLQAALQAVPKFADGWNILGGLYEQQKMFKEAQDALQHAVDANPKLIATYLRLARVANKMGDWDAATKNEDTVLKLDSRLYPEVYLQQGITRFEQKNLNGAVESLKKALSMNPTNKLSRAEYVLGMVALAMGDINGAKEHIAAYMMADPTTPDIERIQVQLDNLGKPEANVLNITLERP